MWASAIFRRSDGTSRTRERIRPEHDREVFGPTPGHGRPNSGVKWTEG